MTCDHSIDVISTDNIYSFKTLLKILQQDMNRFCKSQSRYSLFSDFAGSLSLPSSLSVRLSICGFINVDDVGEYSYSNHKFITHFHQSTSSSFSSSSHKMSGSSSSLSLSQTLTEINDIVIDRIMKLVDRYPEMLFLCNSVFRC